MPGSDLVLESLNGMTLHLSITYDILQSNIHKTNEKKVKSNNLFGSRDQDSCLEEQQGTKIKVMLVYVGMCIESINRV